MTRSLAAAQSSSASNPTSCSTSRPPRFSNSAIQAGILRRWSTDWAAPSSRALHSMALLPSGLRTTMPMPSTAGHSLAHQSSASSRSVCSAVSNMHWLDMTGPSAMSCPVRFE